MLSGEHKGWIGMAPLFDPEDGITIHEPPGKGRGYWIGAPGVIYDDEREKFYIYFRRRRPRDIGPDRGYECGISESSDGISFNEIWTAPKSQFGSISVERGALVKTLEGKYRLYLGYVDPSDNMWKIDMVEADSPEKFNPETRKLIFAPEDCGIEGVEGVKDPYILIVGGKYYMLVSYATNPKATDGLHDTADVFNTGNISSNTGLALSSDGINFEWMGDILSPPGSGWNAYAARIACVLYIPPIFNAFYDGGADVSENYEEKTGLAITFNLMNYQHVSEKAPLLTSPHASGSLRYMDVVRLDGYIYYYYEYARPDGSHELRVNKVKT